MFLDSPLFAGTPFKLQAKLVYSDRSLDADIARLSDAWILCQASRDRDAIYTYLTAVFELVEWWTAQGYAARNAIKALNHCSLPKSTVNEPFAAVIAATVHPIVLDKRLVSKWSRALRFTLMVKRQNESASTFIKRRGGINSCAEGYSRRLGRRAGSTTSSFRPRRT